MGNLSNLYISQSFQSLIHLGTNNTASATLIGLEDGYGNPIGISVNTAGDLSLSGSFTASLQNGYTYVGNSVGKTVAVATSSFASLINTGSFVITSSFNAYTESINTYTASINSYTASNDQKVNSLIAKTGSYLTTGSAFGTQIVYGKLSFAATSSNAGTSIELFNTGSDVSGSMEFGVTDPGSPYIKLKKQTWFQLGPRDEIYYPAFTSSFDNGIFVGNYFSQGKVGLLATSGSLGLFGGSPTANRILSNIQTTATLSQTSTNLVFVNNSGTTTTIVSGSNNIWTNPTTVTSGFNRYIGGSQNYFGLTLPQLTGSAAFSPSMNNNIISTGMLMRLPVSSSAYTLNGNIFINPTANGLQLGIAAATNFEKAVSGLTMNGNIVNGVVAKTAYKTPLSASINFINNNIGGNLTLNMDSSSVGFTNNFVQGNATVNNSYYPSTYNATSANLSIATNIIIGGATIYASGSNTTFTGPSRTISNSSLIGNNNIISASLNGDLAQVNSTNLIGQSLTVYGNNSRPTAATAADWGSVFVGRWNDISLNKAYTADSVFVVGTGTGASTRKNGLLIDSGSNTYIEGSLNVSGSTSTTGSITIQSGSGDLYIHGHKQFNCGAWQDTTTQSGSADTPYAFKFNTVDVLDGVFLSGSTGLQAGSAGIYNLQFSVQISQGASSADVTIWIRKNGTDVAGSAGRITIASNHKALPAWTYMLELNSNDVIELMWASTQSNTTIEFIPASGIYPSIASIIASMQQVR